MNEALDSQEPVRPDDEALLRRLEDELTNPPFHDVLRPVAERVNADGSITIRLPYREELCGRRGAAFFHGGVVASLVDIAAHAAIAMRLGQMAPTIDLRIDYLRTAPANALIATARILKLGRSVSRADVEIRSASGDVVAVGRGAFSTLA